MTRARASWSWIAAGAMAVAAVPALADIKAGVEAWNHGDYPRAVAEWRGPASAGDPDAEYNMGQAYKLGRGVPADLPQAEIWYQKAATKGHPLAQDNYGLALFQDGRKADALPWLEKSAARDEKRTELVLGTMLFNGDSVAKDWVRAYALVSRSSQQGLPQASQTLAQMDGYLSPEQRQQGVVLASRIADQGRSAKVTALADAPVVRGIGGTGAQLPVTPRPASGSIATAEIPSSTAQARHPSPDRIASPAHADTPKSVPARDHAVHASPSAPAVARTGPAPNHASAAVKTGGRWKVQLGAFRDDGNARALWSRVGSRVGGQPVYTKANGVTRLQAGPFASRTDAERACHAAGSSCVVIP